MHSLIRMNVFQATDAVLQEMRKWLDAKQAEVTEKHRKNEEAIKSVHHTRLLLNLFLRELAAKRPPPTLDGRGQPPAR